MSGKLATALHVNKLEREELERRQRRRDILKAEAELRDREAKEAAFRRTWGWKGEGQRSLHNFKYRFSHVKGILLPYEYKKNNIKELKIFIKRAKLHKEELLPIRTLFRSVKLLARASRTNALVAAARAAATLAARVVAKTPTLIDNERNEVSNVVVDMLDRVEVHEVLVELLTRVMVDVEDGQSSESQDTLEKIPMESPEEDKTLLDEAVDRVSDELKVPLSSEPDIQQQTRSVVSKDDESVDSSRFLAAQNKQPSAQSIDNESVDSNRFTAAQYKQASVDNKDEDSVDSSRFLAAQYKQPSVDNKDEDSVDSSRFLAAQYKQPSAQSIDNESVDSNRFTAAQYKQASVDNKDEDSVDSSRFLAAQYKQPSAQSIDNESVDSNRFTAAQYKQASVDNKDEDKNVSKRFDPSVCKKDDDSVGSEFVNKQYEHPTVEQNYSESSNDCDHDENREQQSNSIPLMDVASPLPESENEVSDSLDVTGMDDVGEVVAVHCVGDRVACNYGGFGEWYPGVITNCTPDGLYCISYDDGDSEEDVDFDRIRPLPVHNEENEDESIPQVVSVASEDVVQSLPIRNFDTDSNRTRWEDALKGLPKAILPESVAKVDVEDETESETMDNAPALDSVQLFNPENERVNLFMEGDKVLCDFADQGQWCPGVIARSKLDGLYDVNYFDGDTEADKEESKIIEMPDQNPLVYKYDFHIGDKVLCNYQGRGIWFAGVIKNYKKTHTMGDFVSFDIEYSDGDIEREVVPRNVIPRPFDGTDDDDVVDSEPMLAIQGSDFIPRESNHLEGALYKRMSQRILNAVKPFHFRTRQKNKVIQLKHIVMRQLYTTAFLKDFAANPDQPFIPPALEHNAIEPMKLAYARRIPLSSTKVMLLKMMRVRLEDARKLYQRALSGIEKCEFMLNCTSIFHYKLTGCPKCGVIFVGDVMHLNTFDRATMAPIITTRDFEVDLLADEIVRYEEDFKLKQKKLKDFEAEVRDKTIYDIQAWWASTIAWRKARKRHERLLKSMYWYRIRRLVLLKKAVDRFDPTKIKMNDLEDQFCDVIPELREYRIYKKAKAMKIATRWGLKLLAKAREKLTNGLWKAQRLERLREEARLERQHRRNDEIKVAEELRQDLRALAEEIAKREWTCPRFECKRHKFLSKERFETHMKVHRQMDVEVEAARRAVFLRKMKRLNEEEEIIRQIRAVKGGVKEIGGDLERDGNPTLKNQRLVVGSRPYMLIPQRPGEYRDDQLRAIEKKRQRIQEEEKLRLLSVEPVSVDMIPTVEEAEPTGLEGRHTENGLNDIMKELDIVTKFGAQLQMFEKSKHAKVLEVIDPFEEQARLEREAEEKRIADENLHEGLLKSSTAQAEENILNDLIHESFRQGYSELPQLLALGYRRLKPPSPNSMKKKNSFSVKKIEREEPHSNSNLVLFDHAENAKIMMSSSLPAPLRRVNQADLQCRHDSDLNYDVTYQVKTGKRFTNKAKDEDYNLTFSNITGQPNPRPPKPSMPKHNKYQVENRSDPSNDLVVFDPNSSGNVLATADSTLLIANNSPIESVMELEKAEERIREKEKELSLMKLGSEYIESQHRERRLKEPDWMLMQHRLRLNESIHTQKFVTFEIVSMAKTIQLCNSEFIMNKPIVRFGTLDACDYTIKCSNNIGGDIRKERSLSKIHCMVYVPLISPKSGSSNTNGSSQGSAGVREKQFVKSYDSDSDDEDSDEGSNGLNDNEKRASQVTIVDNHSMWGTYVVTQRGVRKVPTTIQAGIPLEHGDLICMGITRNGPEVMTAIEANRALLVFRVRTDYCVTIGKVPEFDVGEMIMAEQEKFERPERAQYR